MSLDTFYAGGYYTIHGEYDTWSSPKTSVHEASFLE